MRSQDGVTRQDVASFLREFATAVELGHKGYKGRKKNTQGLIDLGLTENQAWAIITSLSPDNYHKGPEPDDTDPKKDVWKFGYDHEGTEVYIKLRLAQHPSRRTVRHAVVWSFHPAEHPLSYPLRGKRK